MKKTTLISICCLYASLFIQAQLPTDFSDQLVSNNWQNALGITFDDKGQGYLWEKRGMIHIIDTNGVKLPTPLLDIREECANWDDHGINSVALDPFFSENGYFYVAYVVERNYLLNQSQPDYDPNLVLEKEATIGRVTRFQADMATNFTSLVPNSRKVLLGETKETGIPVLNVFHGVGTIIASEDGTLLISCGDATPGIKADGTDGDAIGFAEQALADGILSADQMLDAFRAQYLGSYNGKVIRIDAVTGEGLPSNPFYDSNAPNAIQSKVWSRGLRNPYRMCMRPETSGHIPADGTPGVLFIGDVGEGLWEELNVVKKAGQNFGWPILEAKSGHSFYYNNAMERAYPNAINPIGNSNSCNQEFFSFYDLFTRRYGPDAPIFHPNPCDDGQMIPNDIFPSVESAPAIFWSNQRWNQPPKSFVPYFPTPVSRLEWANTADVSAPVYSESFDGYSALAGVFYESEIFPETYHNKLFVYDFSGWIRILEFDDNHDLVNIENFHDAAEQIIHMAENPKDGCLYYINNYGELHKICYGGNPPPIAIAKADQFYGNSPLTVAFDASESYDIFDLPIVDYEWNFGNGQVSNEMNPIFTFETMDNQPTAFPVILTVTDSLGATGKAELTISLNNTPPEVDISSLEMGWFYARDESSPIELLSTVSDNEFANEDLNYQWAIDLHHNVHAHPGKRTETDNSFLLIFGLGCDGEEYWYDIELTVSDPAGLSTTTNRIIFPDCEPAFIEYDKFKVTSENEKDITIQFMTNPTEPIQRYEIQRSNDYLHYFPIGVLTPNGTNTYQLEDQLTEKGTFSYRIKAITESGRFAYSNYQEIFFFETGLFKVFPNPASSQVNISYEVPENEVLKLLIYNASGMLISEEEWTAAPAQIFERSITTHFFGEGLYYYQFLDGTQSYAGSFVIIRS